MKKSLSIKFTLAILGFASVFSGCITRAPTTYELDRRAGFTIPGVPELPSDLSKIHTNSNIPRSAFMPVRLPPLVEKVWVADTTLAEGVKLQGTWLFLEVEPGRWLDEIDSGAAPLTLAPAPQNLTTTKTPLMK